MSSFINLQNRLNVAQFIGNNAIPSLARLRKTTPIDYDIAITFLVRDLMNAFAGPYKAADTQVASIAEAIASQYYYFGLEELIYVFGKSKSSIYGSANFSGIDQAQIMRWIEAYDLGERAQIIESKRKVVQKEQLTLLQVKELASLIPFAIVVGKYPDCKEADYMEASIEDLQQLFLHDVLAQKARECHVTYQEYQLFYPNALPKSYLSRDSYAIKIEFEKRYEKAWQNAVTDLKRHGFEQQNRNIMAYLAKLITTNYEKYQTELSRLVQQLTKKAKRQSKYQYYQKYKKGGRKKRRFRQYAHQENYPLLDA